MLIMERLEKAIQARNPVLAGKLRPGIAEAKMRKILLRAGVKGTIEPILVLFGWRDGSQLDGSEGEWESPFPRSRYIFQDLDMAASHFKQFKDFAAYHSRFAKVAGQFFPLFWDGANSWIAVGLVNGEVVLINGQSENPIVEAYQTFDHFVQDAIEANEKGKPLRCLP